MKNSSGQKIILTSPNPYAPKEDSRHGDKSYALRARRRAPLGSRVSVRDRAARRRLSDDRGADRAWESGLAPGLSESAEPVLRFGASPFAGDDALSHLLPGRELSPAHDRVRHG